MSYKIPAGIALPLKLVLADGANDKYVMARVYNGADVEIAESPFYLTNVGQGYYTNRSYTVPVTATELTAVYSVYEDGAYTIPSFYIQAEEDFVVGAADGSLTDAEVWSYTSRTLTQPVATPTDVTDAVAAILAGVPHQWEPKLSASIDPNTDTLELLAWLVLDGETLTDATSASVKILDGAGNVILDLALDPFDTVQGVFEWTASGAKDLLPISKAYAAELSITRASVVYTTVIGLTVLPMPGGPQVFSYGTVVVPQPPMTEEVPGLTVPIVTQPPAEAMQNYPQIFGHFVSYQGRANTLAYGVDGSNVR